MKNKKKLADKLDKLVDQMFKACQTLKPIPREYLLFRETLTPDDYWVILIFFKTGELNKAIKNGTCYKIHEYFYNNLNPIEDLNKIIFFEEGEIPEDPEELNEIFTIATEKLIAIADGTESPNCNICNHNFHKHQFVGVVNKELGYPTKGFLTCPEENCNCFKTWNPQLS